MAYQFSKLGVTPRHIHESYEVDEVLSLKQLVKSGSVNEIYLDLDDTLNTFTASVGVLYGVATDDFDLSWCQHKHGFDLIEQIKGAYETRRTHALIGEFDYDSFWWHLPPSLWSSTPQSKHCDDLVVACMDAVGPENVFIATSPTKNPNSASGKMHWINTYIHPLLRRNYQITPRKEKLSAPGRLLIDDCQLHLDNWVDRGGLTFTVPKPWNRNHYYNGDDTRAIMEFIGR
jgi:hypothetical protein